MDSNICVETLMPLLITSYIQYIMTAALHTLESYFLFTKKNNILYQVCSQGLVGYTPFPLKKKIQKIATYVHIHKYQYLLIGRGGASIITQTTSTQPIYRRASWVTHKFQIYQIKTSI